MQGGELSRSEAMRLLALEGMDDAMALRRWDDRAKVHGVEVPDLDAYRQVVLDHLV
jgi:predicted HD phosphohydrolase